MAQDPTYPLYAQDFIMDTMFLSDSETTAYCKLEALCWMKPDLKIEEANKVHPLCESMAKKFPAKFVITDGKITCITHVKTKEFRAQKKENGKKGGAPKKQTNNQNNNQDSNQNQNQNNNPSNEIEVEERIKKEKEKKKAAAKKTADAEPFFNPAKELWFNFYRNVHPKNGLSPSFDNIAGGKVKSILKKLKSKTTEANGEWNEDNALESFTKILDTGSKMKWLKDNFTLNNIDSQLDTIIQNALKNNNGTQDGTSDIFDKW